jgi:FMN phosphatase YigB (HAD superfamily)
MVELATDLLLFNLDNTLISSDSLTEIRHSNNKYELEKFLQDSDLVPYAGIIEALDFLAEEVALGIVTNSPRWYATRLTEKFFPTINFYPFITYDEAVSANRVGARA